MAKCAKIGDLIELTLPDGRLAYMQYVNEHRNPPYFGSLLTIFCRTHNERPTDLQSIAASQILFCTFFPLFYGLRYGTMRIVEHFSVPEKYKEFPIFKDYNENFETGVRTWYLCDGDPGQTAVKVGKLKPEYMDYPSRAIITLPILEERIINEWTEASDLRPGDFE